MSVPNPEERRLDEERLSYVEEWLGSEANSTQESVFGFCRELIAGIRAERDRLEAAERERDALDWASRKLQEEADRADAAESALAELDAWVARMPDAGFTDQDPRWEWWHQRPRVVLAARPGEQQQ